MSSKKINIGDEIYLEVTEDEEISLKPYDYKLDIVFEDHDKLVR